MAETPTAEQKAAADKAAAEKQAADEKAKQEAEAKAAEEKAKADAAAKADATKAPGVVVLGAAVVLRTSDGSERYLYRGAPVDVKAFDEKSVKHATSAGLIGKPGKK